MKRTICLVFIALMVASVAFAAAITEKNVASLKGTYEGMLSFGTTAVGAAMNAPAKLEILNDKFPLQARFSITNVPDAVAAAMGVGTGGNLSFESDEGELTTKGTVIWVGKQGGNFVDIALTGPGKLKVTYNARRVSGDGNFKKK